MSMTTDDNGWETDDPTYWRELALACGRAVRMRGGEVVIGGNRTSNPLEQQDEEPG